MHLYVLPETELTNIPCERPCKITAKNELIRHFRDLLNSLNKMKEKAKQIDSVSI